MDSTFSIIVPTCGRPDQLARCVENLGRLDAAPDTYEIVVVDDGSPAPLDDVVAPFRAGSQVTLLRQENQGPAIARNTGAAAARGRFLAFTDDDCYPAPDWLARLGTRLHAHPDRIFGGLTINGLTANVFATASQMVIDVVYAFYNADPENARFFASNNLAMSAELFRTIGGFDAGFFRLASEDRELCDRARHLGYRLNYAPEATVRHEHPLTLRRFCRQHFNYGRGARRYHRRRAERGSGGLEESAGFHARLPGLLREPLSRLTPARRIAVLPVLALWLGVNATGFLYEATRG